MFSSFFGQTKENVLVCNADTLPGFYAAMAIHESGNFQDVVCAVSDREDEFSKKLERAGLQLREWKLDDRKSVERAVQGLNRGVLIPSPNDNIRENTENILEAMKSQDFRHLVFWSTMGVEQSEEQHQKSLRQLLEAEEMAKRCGLHNVTICRIGFAQQKLFLLSHIIQDRGVLPLPTGRGRFAPVNLRDCGHASARILSGQEDMHHKHQTYTFTGPNLLTGRKLVEHANRVLQAEIEYEDIDSEQFRKILKDTHEVNDWELQAIIEVCDLVRDNRLATRTDDLNRILGKDATDIETFFKNNADSFRPNGGRLRRLAVRELQL